MEEEENENKKGRMEEKWGCKRARAHARAHTWVGLAVASGEAVC